MAEKTNKRSKKGRIKIATAQFAVSADIAKNAQAVRRWMRRAAKMGADVAHFLLLANFPEKYLYNYIYYNIIS